MANYPKLEHLFYSGEIEECIILGERYLKENPDDIDVLLLLAVAYHDIVYYEDPMVVFDAIRNYTTPYLKRAIALDPDHHKALQHLLHYTLQHQQVLEKTKETVRLISMENRNEYLNYARQLVVTEGFAVNGYAFLWQIHETLDEPESQLRVADEAISFFEKKFRHNREKRDIHVSDFWIKKILLLQTLPTVSVEEICALIKVKLTKIVTKNEEDYLLLAEIAYKSNDIRLAVQALTIPLQNDRSFQVLADVAEKWYGRIRYELNNGNNQPELELCRLQLERSYFDVLELSDDHYYNQALQAIEKYPNAYFGYHFAGLYLFELKEYKQAISFFEKAINSYPLAETVRCYIECYVYVRHEVPEIPKMKSHPKEIYEETTYLDDWDNEFFTTELVLALYKVRLEFYEQAYLAFHAYLDDNLYQSLYHCNYQLFSVCCNNLATIHRELGQYLQAASIAEEGLQYANFWELHALRVETLVRIKLFEEAKIAIDEYFESISEEDIPFLKHLTFLANRIEIAYQLSGDDEIFEDSKTLLYQIYDYKITHPNLVFEDAADLEAAKTIVQTTFYNFVEKLDNESQLMLFEKDAAKYPSESHPQYMLMQLYHEKKEYKLCNQAAYAYLQNKAEFAMSDFDKARVINFILETHVLAQEYDRASVIYDENNRLAKEELSQKEYMHWLLYSIDLKFELGQYEELHLLTVEFLEGYRELDWGVDIDMQKVLLLQARALYHQGKAEEAIVVLDELIQFNNHDPIADTYKKQWQQKGPSNRRRPK